jgi:hypothetical protein
MGPHFVFAECQRPSRRSVLLGSSAALFGAMVGSAATAQSALTLDRFIEVSSHLCGLPLTSRTMGADILALLSHEFQPDRMLALANTVESSRAEDLNFHITGGGLDALVRRLVAAWYSGIVRTKNGGERLLSYTEAAGWAATGYAKPPTYCGVFGEWADPPELAVIKR